MYRGAYDKAVGVLQCLGTFIDPIFRKYALFLLKALSAPYAAADRLVSYPHFLCLNAQPFQLRCYLHQSGMSASVFVGASVEQ